MFYIFLFFVSFFMYSNERFYKGDFANMIETTLPTSAGEKQYYSLPDMYSSSLTVVSYLSTDPKVGGSYKDLFAPSFISVSEKNGLEDLVSKFLHKNYHGEPIVFNSKATLEDKIDFLLNEGYFVAPVFVSPDNVYSEVFKENYKEVGGIITTRGNQQEQAKMLAKELNGEPFVFNILYQNTKMSLEDLSKPLYPVISKEEVNEAIEQISLKESKELAKKDWRNLKDMSSECRKNCWLEAITQDARAFAFAPEEVKANQWSIISAIKKTNRPDVILEHAKHGDGLLKACHVLLGKKMISFEQLPENLQKSNIFSNYNKNNHNRQNAWVPQKDIEHNMEHQNEITAAR